MSDFGFEKKNVNVDLDMNSIIYVTQLHTVVYAGDQSAARYCSDHRRRLLEMTVGAGFPLSLLLPLLVLLHYTAFPPDPPISPLLTPVTPSSPVLSPPVHFLSLPLSLPLLVKSSYGTGAAL